MNQELAFQIQYYVSSVGTEWFMNLTVKVSKKLYTKLLKKYLNEIQNNSLYMSYERDYIVDENEKYKTIVIYLRTEEGNRIESPISITIDKLNKKINVMLNIPYHKIITYMLEIIDELHQKVM